MSAVDVRAYAAPDFFGVSRFLKTLREDEPGFYGLAVVMLLAMAPTVFAASIDERIFLGIDNWIKPLKFEAALFVYLATLTFFAGWLPHGTTERRWYRIYRGVVIAAIVAEMIWIAGAASLGTASHFNRSPVGGIIYPFMGLGAVILTTPTAVYAWLIARNRSMQVAPAIREAVIIGLALVLPLTLITAGTMSSMDGHAIGGSGASAGGFPIMGWARDAGDLRVAHFFATHSMHFIPIFGVILVLLFGASARWPVRLFAVIFVAFIAWTYVEALAGRPFLASIG